MSVINVSQNKNDGSAAQDVMRERRNPSATPTQKGAVCTICRSTNLLARPTPTTNARIIATQQIATESGALCRMRPDLVTQRLRLLCCFLHQETHFRVRCLKIDG